MPHCYSDRATCRSATGQLNHGYCRACLDVYEARQYADLCAKEAKRWRRRFGGSKTERRLRHVVALAAIKAQLEDYDAAAEYEHQAWLMALAAINNGHPKPLQLARLAMKTVELEFRRG